ncbi:MAG: hypothetical protein ABEJ89_02695 [Haloarculaceae archaeon]
MPTPAIEPAGSTGSSESGLGTQAGFVAAAVGTVAGILAPVVGYALTYSLLAPSARAVLRRHAPVYGIAQAVIPAHVDAVPTWKLVGWLFYNAHGGQVQFTVLGELGANALNFVADEGGAIGWLWLLPAALLVVAGAAVVLVAGVGGLRDGALAGAAIAPAYAVVVLAAAPEFAVTAAGYRMALPSSFVAVIVFPLCFGALGGALVGALRRRSP